MKPARQRDRCRLLHTGEPREREPLPRRRGDDNLLQGPGVVPVGDREPDREREASPRLQDLPDPDAARRGDGIEDMPGGDAVAGEGVPIDLDAKDR